MDISRRAVLAGGLAVVAGLISRPVAAAKPAITVYKSATCGCCALWVTHLKDNGFPTTAEGNLSPIMKKCLMGCRRPAVRYTAPGRWLRGGSGRAVDLSWLLLAEPRWGIAVLGMPLAAPPEVPGPRGRSYQVLS
jgi:hypothetical protein